uniref:Protein transport protein Sec61 subunit gamma n=1 Tax=Catagonus wagneri TaxID=51154 RepID=A0A8C3VZ74_9CETA
MGQITQFVEPSRQFIKDSVRLVKNLREKNSRRLSIATAIGFSIMGFTGFFVKLIHIPINNIIAGSSHCGSVVNKSD